jgi:hypothetical protein
MKHTDQKVVRERGKSGICVLQNIGEKMSVIDGCPHLRDAL